MDDRKIAIRGTLCAISGGVCWGFSGTMGQFLFSQKGLTTSWVTTVRMLIAGVLLLGVMAARRPKEVRAIGKVWTVKKDVRRLLLLCCAWPDPLPIYVSRMYRQLQFCHGDGAELFGADDDLTLCLLCDETPADPLGDHSAFAGVPGGVLFGDPWGRSRVGPPP
ncbi:MAG: hypothetical protein ACLUN5_13900 [Oscillospiraceae bacterium]